MPGYVEPRFGYDHDAQRKFVRCVCGASMQAEEGVLFDDDGQLRLMWWRCIDNSAHITRSLPLPVQMARSV